MIESKSSAAALAPQDERAARWRAIKERTTRGLMAFNRGDVLRLIGDEWAVRASEGGYWLVDYAAETCNCPDFEHYGSRHDVPCKHLFAVAIAHATRRRHRPCACIDGWVYIGHEEDGEERQASYRCRRCQRS